MEKEMILKNEVNELLKRRNDINNELSVKRQQLLTLKKEQSTRVTSKRDYDQQRREKLKQLESLEKTVNDLITTLRREYHVNEDLLEGKNHPVRDSLPPNCENKAKFLKQSREKYRNHRLKWFETEIKRLEEIKKVMETKRILRDARRQNLETEDLLDKLILK